MAADEAGDLEDPLGRDTLAVDLSDGIELWTDGACSGNPGPGGWAYCLVKDGQKVGEDAGYAPETTNNRMEMQGVIAGLDRLHAGATVTVRTDSQLIVDTIQKGWKRKKNCDLWTQLDAAIARHDQVTFEHVRGHKGVHWNEHVDQLAVAQYQQRQ
ncbi:hypothetical protein CKO28_02725 [Rhodovibrio sodomensis]|uniref:RNase H type-1 domain-containing protein n=2 Tax=Rhodovibrio sodomensis TaxID=1088 RepID=A0ABS1D968_9PROT|nr:hypothetical protein [Rhodovibrio sodomensis]